MSEEEIKQVVQGIKSALAQEAENIHTRITALGSKVELLSRDIDALTRKISEMEQGIINELSSQGRRIYRLEQLTHE